MESWNLVLRMPAEAKGWRVDVLVYDSANDELRATDQGNLMSLTTRKRMAGRLAEQLKLEEARADTLATDLDKAWLSFYGEYQRTMQASPAQASAAELLEEMPRQVRLDAERLLGDRALFQVIRNDLDALGIAGERALAVTSYLVGTSRQLEKPMSMRVHGPTASGKNFVPDTVAECFPSETIIRATQITPQAFFHLEPGALKHRFVIAGERSRKEDDDAAEKTRALRELLAAGRLSKLICLKGPGGAIVTKLIEQDGPIAYIESTSLARVFEEDANRCLTVHTDERAEQTECIVKKQAAHYEGNGVCTGKKIIIERHHAIQRLLQPCGVAIPYAARLGDLFDYERVELRRGFPQIMSMIQAIALVHQWQRERDGEGRLLATREDYELARALLVEPMRHLLGAGIPDPTLRFFEHLRTKWGEREFSTTQARKEAGKSKEAVRGWLCEMLDADLVKVITEARGSMAATWALTGNEPQVSNVLPKPDEVFSAEYEWSHGHNA
jgi:hypothetical protein